MKYTIQIEAPKIDFGGDWWIINKWHYSNGDQVSLHDVICDMENDTVTCEMESFDEGEIEIVIKEGRKVAVGEIIAVLHEPSSGQKS